MCDFSSADILKHILHLTFDAAWAWITSSVHQRSNFTSTDILSFETLRYNQGHYEPLCICSTSRTGHQGEDGLSINKALSGKIQRQEEERAKRWTQMKMKRKWFQEGVRRSRLYWITCGSRRCLEIPSFQLQGQVGSTSCKLFLSVSLRFYICYWRGRSESCSGPVCANRC